jgi:hypothetical protein
MRIPKRGIGADHSVVAMKGSNEPEAKGVTLSSRIQLITCV